MSDKPLLIETEAMSRIIQQMEDDGKLDGKTMDNSIELSDAVIEILRYQFPNWNNCKRRHFKGKGFLRFRALYDKFVYQLVTKR